MKSVLYVLDYLILRKVVDNYGNGTIKDLFELEIVRFLSFKNI